MKKFLIILAFLPFSLFSQQSVLSSFNGYGDIVNVIDVDPTDSLFTIDINNFYGSPRFQPYGPWIAQDVQVGMVMWVDCARFVITNVNSASFSTMSIDVKVPSVDWNLGVATPLPNSRCAVVYEDQYLLTALPAPADGNSGALSGINNTLFACMLNHYSQALLVTKNSVNEITDYVAGLDTIPSEAPGPNIGETWRNSVGQLFYSDGTQWLTDKEIKFSNAPLQGLPSYLYKLGIDTLGQDTLYIANNGIFNRFQSGLVYKEGYGINIYATDSIEVDTNQIATQYDISLLPTGIDTFQLNNDTLKLSLVNDFEPFKKVILPVVGINSGVGISTASSGGVHTITNTAPDQVVSITGAGISNVTGTYPNFTVTSTEVDGSTTNEGLLSVGAGTGTTSIIQSNTSGSNPITLTGAGITTVNETGNTITITSTEVDGSTTNELQTLSTASNTVTLSNSGGSFTIAGAGINTVGTVGSTITVTGTEIDGSISNEGILGVGAGSATSSTILSNTSTSTPITLNAAGIISITETTSSNGGSITLTGTEVDGSITNEIQDLSLSGQTLSLTSDPTTVTLPVIGITAGTGISTSSTSGNFTITNTGDLSNTNELQQIDTFRVNGSNLELSLQNDNQAVRTVSLSSIVTGGGGLTGNGVLNYLSQYNSSSTLDTTGVIWVGGRLGVGLNSPSERLDVNGRVKIATIDNGTGDFITSSATGVLTKRTAAQVLSDIGGISGTGVNGQVAYFNGAQSLTSSSGLTYSGGTQIRFTSTSPSMQINGTTNDAPYGLTYLFNGAGRFRYVFDNSTNRWFLQGSDANGDFTTTPSILVQRISNNFVGINLSANTSPQSQLTVNGNTFIGGNVAASARLHIAGATALGTDRALLVTDNATTPVNLFEVRNNGNLFFNAYPNTLNTAGNPVNVLSTGTDGLLQSHPISEVISSAGGVTGSGVAGQVTFWNGTSTVSGSNGLVWYGNAANNTSGLGVGAIQFNGFGTGVSMAGQGFASPGANRTLYMKSGTNNNVNDVAGIIIDAGVLGNRTASSSFSGLQLISDLQSPAGSLTSYSQFISAPLVRHPITTFIGYDYNPAFESEPTNNYAALFRKGKVGIGTATPSTILEAQAISDAALVGSTNLASGFASTVVGSWVFDAVNSRWDHITGNTNTLTATVSNISAATQIYRATVTIVNRTAGSIRLSLKGSSWPVALTGTSTIYFEQVNAANNLVVTPTSDFNGSVSIVINSITEMPATTSLKNTSGTVVYEERATVAISNILQGVGAGKFAVSGGNRVYIGQGAGKNSITSGNIAIGTEAGMSNYSGGGWAAIGSQAGTSNISGINWYAIGNGAGQVNVSGNNWFAIGTSAARFNRTGSSFVAIGERAAFSDTTASSFIAIGASAAINHLAGNAFVAIGAEAAAYYTGAGFTSATDFSNGVYIGYQARVGANGAANETVIGYQALGLGTNTTRIGNTSTIQTHLDGRLTIGNTFYDSRVAARIVGADASTTNYSLVVTDSDGATSTSVDPNFVVRNDGLVGIGTYSPTAKLQINGTTSDNSATSFKVVNNLNQNLFDVRNDGQLGIGTINFWYSYNDATGVATRVATGGLMRISYGATGATGSGYGLFVANGQATNRDYTSGEGGGFRLGEGYAPTSGTGIYNSFLIGGTINQTGGANGITRGILIAPTLTAAADYRAIQWNNSTGFGLYGDGTAPNLLNGRLFIPTGNYDNPSLSFVGDANTGLYRPLEDNLELKTGTNNAIALENQATNLKTYSENFTTGGWVYQNITLTIPGNVTAPDGTSTANLAVPNTTLAQHRLYYILSISEPYTLSVYAKSAGYNFISFGQAGGVSGQSIIFDIVNGTISGSENGYSAQIENVGNGWFRCSLIRTSTAAPTSVSRWIIVRNANSNTDYAGDGTSGVYLWGHQLETGLGASSYVRTDATTITRPQAVSVLGPNVYGTLLTKTLGSQSFQDLSFTTQNATRMTITNGGSVGIGTTLPNSRLDVQGTTAAHGVSTNIGYNVTTVTAPVLNQASVVVSAGGNMTPGTHHFKVTYYNAFGGTEGSNTITAVTDTINKTVTFDLPVSTNPTVIGRRIYKSIVPQNASYGTLIATVANNTATSFTYSSIDPIPNPVNTNPVAAIPNLTSNYFTKDGTRSFVISNSLVSVGPFINSNLVAGPNVALTTGNAFNSGISIANNVTIGSASPNLTTGAGNVVVGYDALALGTTASYNIAIGQFALNKTQTSERHVAVGYSALNNVTSGQYNVGIGMLSGNNITTGSNNTFLGSIAGSTFTGNSALTSVSNSIFVGYNSAAFANSSSYETVIGVSIAGLGNNTTRIGSGSNTNQTHLDGRLTVGNTLYDANTTARIVGLNNTASTYALVVTNSTNGTNTTLAPALVVTNTQNIGIGTSAPAKTLHVTGEVRISDLDNGIATRIVGANADGDIDELTLGSGLSITSGTISVTNPISASEVFIESSTATTIDLDANTGVVKDVNGTNASFTLPTDLSRLNVYKNGIRLARTGSATTRDFSVNTGTNEITFTTALLSTDRIVIVKI